MMELKNGVRKLVRLRGDEPRCVLCDETDPSELTVDHIIPRNMGGTNQSHNKVILCFKCNITKNDKTPDEFWGWYRQRIFIFLRHIKVYRRLNRMLGKQDEIMNGLRELYRQKRYAELKSEFYRNIFYLKAEDRIKIARVLEGLKIPALFPKAPPQQLTIEDAQKIMGGRIMGNSE